MDNPGRYLTLVLPINGADAISGTPYFPSGPGLQLHAYDGTATFDWMPSQFVTFRTEFGIVTRVCLIGRVGRDHPAGRQ